MVQDGEAPRQIRYPEAMSLIRCLCAQEIGPYGIGWKPRQHTWVRAAVLSDLCRLCSEAPELSFSSYLSPHRIACLTRVQASAANLLFLDNPVGTGWSYVEKHGDFGECSWQSASCRPPPELLPGQKRFAHITATCPARRVGCANQIGHRPLNAQKRMCGAAKDNDQIVEDLMTLFREWTKVPPGAAPAVAGA